MIWISFCVFDVCSRWFKVSIVTFTSAICPDLCRAIDIRWKDRRMCLNGMGACIRPRKQCVLDQTLYEVLWTFGSSYNLIQCFWIYLVSLFVFYWAWSNTCTLYTRNFIVFTSFNSIEHQAFIHSISPIIFHVSFIFALYLNILSPVHISILSVFNICCSLDLFWLQTMAVILFGYTIHFTLLFTECFHIVCYWVYLVCCSPSSFFVEAVVGSVFVYNNVSMFCTSKWLCGILLEWK